MKRHVSFMKRHVWIVSYLFIKWLIKIETSSTFLNSYQKILENTKKFRFSNFHLENSRTWIFTIWNHVLQTQTSLLQPILIYTYIYNSFVLTKISPPPFFHIDKVYPYIGLMEGKGRRIEKMNKSIYSDATINYSI